MVKTVDDAVHPDESTAEDLLDPLSLSEIKERYPEILNTLLSSYVLDNRDDYRARRTSQQAAESASKQGLGAQVVSSDDKPAEPIVKRKNIVFAINDYMIDDEDTDHSANSELTSDFDFEKIIPRSQKAKEIQKRRVKEKAEVFTPTWVCNLQNNLIDDDLITGDKVKAAFNTLSEDQKTWTPTSEPIDWTHYADKKGVDVSTAPIEYIEENRLEITMGEAPYLVSPYDTVTGEYLPVRDDQGRFQRIGLLDRKMRVVNEYIDYTITDDESQGDKAIWESLTYGAFASTYGYEWQGDNLILARLNVLNTYRDYYYDRWNKEPSVEELHQIAVIVSMNMWQMDGLKAIVPLSENPDNDQPDRETGYYDGVVPVVSFKHGTISHKVAFKNENIEELINTDPDLEWMPFEEVMGAWLKEKVKKNPPKKPRGAQNKASDKANSASKKTTAQKKSKGKPLFS